MKFSAVLSTMMVAGLVSAAPPAHPPSTDLQQPSGPQGPADSQLAHSKRDDVPPPEKDGQPPKPKDHDHDKRGDVPPPPKDGKDPQPPKHN